jgi:hypothetical protein
VSIFYNKLFIISDNINKNSKRRLHMGEWYEAKCGIECNKCEYREKFDCKGCIASKGKMFWGECKISKCCTDKDLVHCGNCDEFVCKDLYAFAYDEEQGDNGLRIENLKKRMK